MNRRTRVFWILLSLLGLFAFSLSSAMAKDAKPTSSQANENNGRLDGGKIGYDELGYLYVEYPKRDRRCNSYYYGRSICLDTPAKKKNRS